MPQLSVAASWRQESPTTPQYEYLQYDHGNKATNTTKNRQWFITGQGTGSIPAHGPWGTDNSCLRSRLELSEFFPIFVCFWPMQGPGMIFALQGDNIIPQFVTRDANIRNKLHHDPVLTICWWNSWGPVVFTKIKNACQPLNVILLLSPPSVSVSTPSFHFLFFFFYRKAWHWKILDKNVQN